jgi:hypothetical protein
VRCVLVGLTFRLVNTYPPMAKRFTDTEKWKKPLIRNMKAAYKLLWLYILDECDHAGIWHVDIEVAQIKIGEKLDKDEAIKAFGKKIHVFDDGEKWFIPAFIDFQYGELNEKNRAHQSVLKKLSKYGLVIKPLTSPLQGAKDMDMDKDMDKDEGGTGETFLTPMMLQAFMGLFPQYPKDEKKDFFQLREIAEKICSANSWRITEDQEAIFKRWGEIIAHVKKDSHLSRYSITQLNKHFQSVIQSLHGTHKQPLAKGKPGKSDGATNLLGTITLPTGSG